MKPRGRRQGVNICFCFLPLWPGKFQVTVTRTRQPQILSGKKNPREFPNDSQTLKTLNAWGVYFSPQRQLSMERSSPGGAQNRGVNPRALGEGFFLVWDSGFLTERLIYKLINCYTRSPPRSQSLTSQSDSTGVPLSIIRSSTFSISCSSATTQVVC